MDSPLTETIQKGRSLIKVIRRSHILMKFINTEKKCSTALLKHKPVLIYLLEFSSDDYTILKNLIDIFEPFYQTTNLLSVHKYPTIGLCLYLYGYFDPFGYSVLTPKERLKVERQIKQKNKEQNKFQTPTTTSSALISSNGSVYPSIKQSSEKLNRLDTFLKSINKYVSTNNVIQKTISEEIFHYESLVKTDLPMYAVLFWQRYGEQIPILKDMAQKYLSAPGTSVPSESAFSSSAYIGRKARAQLSTENLSYTVFLQDKLITIDLIIHLCIFVFII
ncbi:unnamed protein product [Rotaria magnacalcarata]